MAKKRNDRIVARGMFAGDSRVSDVTVEGGKVTSIRPAGRVEADIGSRNSIIGPTLFDIQVNGANGISIQDSAFTAADVRALTDFLASWGVSRWVPTIITGSREGVEHACRAIAEARAADPVVERAVAGIHLEGPYISPVDGPRGAHDKRHVRPPDLREFDGFMKAARGGILYVTLAPEITGSVRFIRGMAKRGVKVALGHHNAGADDIARAVEAGACLCTHLGNGISALINRHQNPLWPQLASDALSAALIADLEHLPPDALKTFIRAKGRERVILTSDCVHLAGLRPGRYDLGRASVEMLPSGRICLSGTEFLAGSSLMLLQGIVNTARVTDLTLEQAFACATTVPAALLGLKRRFTLPREGAAADFVVFDIDQSQPTWKAVVRGTFVDGVRCA